MYTIKKLAQIAGISTRALRYYDEIGLLKPSSYTDAGYRLYDEKDVDVLQLILLYKSMGMSLNDIHNIIYNPSFDSKDALKKHRLSLIEEKKRIDTLIHTIDKSLKHMEGEFMTDSEKFIGIKTDMIEENEKKYGQEARALFGDKVDESNEKIMAMDEETLMSLQVFTDEMNNLFVEAMLSGNVEIQRRAFDMHVRWLKHYWSSYSSEAHIGLGEMYVMDDRFKAYYDELEEGLAVFVRDTIKKYA